MKALFITFSVLFSSLGAVQAMAQEVTSSEATSESKGSIYIKLGEAQTKKSLLAFPAPRFEGTPGASPNHKAIGSDLFNTIQTDLIVSGYFQMIQSSAFLEDTNKAGLKPAGVEANGFKFDSWKQIGAEFLIKSSFSVAGNSLTLETYTYHVAKNQLILGKKYKGDIGSLRRIAHKFANDVLEALTGKTGMFLSKIVVSSDRAGKNFKEIYLMDWDGANVEKLTNLQSIAISPDISPDGTKIAYTAFVQRAKSKTRNADMFIYDLTNKTRKLVSYRQGINSGASFARDSKHLFLTLSQNASPDIYKMSLDGVLLAKLTNGPRGAMNVEPAVSPDGNRIAFSSDRSGVPMIYIMNADGSNQKRVTFSGKYNSTPAWSPDGSRIAFAGWDDDHYDIFTMNTDGSNMVRITSARKKNGKWSQNESPVFSPDGRLLLYTSDRSGSHQLYISNLDGSEERRITNDSHNYFKPKWSVNLE